MIFLVFFHFFKTALVDLPHIFFEDIVIFQNFFGRSIDYRQCTQKMSCLNFPFFFCPSDIRRHLQNLAGFFCQIFHSIDSFLW